MLFRFWVFAFVFYLGFAVMALEFSASKLLGFYYGSSTLLWTQLISVVLLAMALAYESGSWWIRRQGSLEKVLWGGGACLGLSYLWIYGFAERFLVEASAQIPLWGSIALFYVVPVFLLALLSPILFAWSANQDTKKELSSKMALFSMWGTLGSLAGSLMTTYVLVAFLGLSRMPLLLLSFGLLFALAFSQKLKRGLVAILLLLTTGLLLWNPVQKKEDFVFDKESPYGRVWVESREGVYWLFLGSKRALQSWIVEPEDLEALPKALYHRYAPALVKNLDEPQRALVLGHAGGLYTRFLNAYAPNLQVQAVEINPVTTEATLALIQEPFRNWNITHEDARLFVKKNDTLYDLILLDAFQGLALPAHLVTQEFFHALAEDMSPQAFLAVNLVAEDSLFLRRFDSTLRQVFPWVRAFHIPSSHNILYVASLQQKEGALAPEIQSLVGLNLFKDSRVYEDDFVSLAEKDYEAMMRALLKRS